MREPLLQPAWSRRGPAPPPDRRGRRALAPSEILLVLTILALLATIVAANVRWVLRDDRAARMAGVVADVRAAIEAHRSIPDVSRGSSGYPSTIDPAWFPGNLLPAHAWTGQPLVVETVVSDPYQVFPRVKTFDHAALGAPNAWYNVTNGEFCVRVGAGEGSDDTLADFNTANDTAAIALDQVSE